ncbi:MAG: high-potential iron-sulfur protein [Gammaproteobacteria bacterium]|nr:high-potential iron-sulfur protein [Gammaproteobacteria bacterium]
MNKTRRTFLYALGTGVIAIPLSTLTREGIASAADAPKLDLEDPTAKALEYVHESPDATKLCVGCQLYTGAAGDEWGPCAIFPGKLVNARGWCKSWVVKAG